MVHDVPEGGTVAGYPAFDHRRWLRASVLFSRLADLNQKVEELRRHVGRLVERIGALP